MSDSNWSVRIAAVGCGLAILFIVWALSVSIYSMGWSSGLHHAEADGYAAQYPADTEKRIDECINGALSANSAKCIQEAIAASHEAQRGEQDLQAQRDMAEWAFWMLIVSGASLCVTAIGTAFLAWQVKLTREAVDDTSDATKIMKGQVELAKETAKHQLRAYLGVHSAMYTVAISEQGQVTFAATVQIKNFGQTPAHKFRATLGVNIIDYPVLSVPKVAAPSDGGTDLVPGMQSDSVVPLAVSQESWHKIKNRQACFFVTMHMKWNDFLGNSASMTIRLFCANGAPRIIDGPHTHALSFYNDVA